MRLSIITICYNDAVGLRRTLNSVAMQSCLDFEHVIVDGASKDGSKDVICEYAKSVTYPVQWISEPDKGIYDAMNKGLRMSHGEYIEILNAGDLLASASVVEKMIAALQQSNYPRILYGNMIKHYPTGKEVRDVCLGNRRNKEIADNVWLIRWTLYDFIRGTINHDPAYIHRSLFEKYGYYDDTLRIVSDWKWYFQVVILGEEPVHYTPVDVTIFDMTGISETNLNARENERTEELRKLIPSTILCDYNAYHFPISQYNRLRRYHLWGIAYFIERILFKLEKYGILNKR